VNPVWAEVLARRARRLAARTGRSLLRLNFDAPGGPTLAARLQTIATPHPVKRNQSSWTAISWLDGEFASSCSSADEARRFRRMGLDNRIFVFRQAIRLVEDGIGHANVPKIMQETPTATRATSWPDRSASSAGIRLNRETRQRCPPVQGSRASTVEAMT